MPKVETQKHTLLLRAGDYERISEVYQDRGIKAAPVIRRLVSKFVDKLEVRPTNEDLEHIEGVDD